MLDAREAEGRKQRGHDKRPVRSFVLISRLLIKPQPQPKNKARKGEGENGMGWRKRGRGKDG